MSVCVCVYVCGVCAVLVWFGLVCLFLFVLFCVWVGLVGFGLFACYVWFASCGCLFVFVC